MYSFIIGKIDSIGDGYIVLENNGIGYHIAVSGTTIGKVGRIGETVKVLLWLSVREDEMSLYGFYSKEEKQMFLKLISISGVGPKMAIGILSDSDVNALAVSIISGDTKALSKIKGIGKKTAERIILELKESIGDENINKLAHSVASRAAGGDSMASEALEVLTGLGVSKSDAYSAVIAARQNCKSVNEIVMSVLQSLDR